MDKFEKKDFKRNAKVVKSKMKKVENMIIAKEDLYIIFPNKFVDKDLTILDNVSNILAIIMVVDNKNNYTILTIPGQVEVEPNEIEDIEVDQEHYIKLHIEKDQPLISNINIVKSLDIPFPVFETLLLQGKIPFYLEYEDLLDVFSNLPKYTGSKVGTNIVDMEILVSIVARNPNNLKMNYRNFITNRNMLDRYKPEWIGLKNIYLSFNSTVAKLAGAYFKKGIISAIVDPEKEITDVENVLRQ